jgi:hypothetical protein
VLRATGVTKVVVVQKDQRLLGDLESILRAYQAGGLELQLRDPKRNQLTSLNLSKRSWLSRFLDALRRLSYRRRRGGSFGLSIPEEPSHG